ncbi:hypothetical protein ABZ490_22475 [Streptomyces sp. NPDC005811]|uniref:hypothetical protein n=1 Tax=Streptomyces sp. NPDC005811 TaxID=3154565 RepID=UPI0033F3BCBD
MTGDSPVGIRVAPVARDEVREAEHPQAQPTSDRKMSRARAVPYGPLRRRWDFSPDGFFRYGADMLEGTGLGRPDVVTPLWPPAQDGP